MVELKVSPGFNTIEEEFEASLRKAFVDCKAKKIIIDSRHKHFQLASANFGIEKGWLEGTLVEYDEQSSAYEFRLTEVGKKYFGLMAK
jgi:hypothetical protein